MRFDPQAGCTEKKEAETTRRSSGRLPQEGLRCNLGVIRELSAGGMSVLCRRKPRKKVHVKIYGYELPEPLVGEVKRVKRLGFFQFECGVSFEGLSETMARQLTTIAGMNRYRRTL